MAIHSLEHLQAGSVQSHNRKVVIERGKPPFVGMMLVGDQIRNMPGQEIEGVSCEVTRFVNSNSRLHGSILCERRSLHEGCSSLQELAEAVEKTALFSPARPRRALSPTLPLIAVQSIPRDAPFATNAFSQRLALQHTELSAPQGLACCGLAQGCSEQLYTVWSLQLTKRL